MTRLEKNRVKSVLLINKVPAAIPKHATWVCRLDSPKPMRFRIDKTLFPGPFELRPVTAKEPTRPIARTPARSKTARNNCTRITTIRSFRSLFSRMRRASNSELLALKNLKLVKFPFQFSRNPIILKFATRPMLASIL